MAALAYLFLPVSGLFVYLRGANARVRWHGLQAIFIGFVWPVALFACTYASPGVTQAGFVLGAAIWIGFLVATAAGKDPRIPLVGIALRRAAAGDPRVSAGIDEEDAAAR